MSQRRGLVVADDLSGATDTGHEFAARGYATTVVAGDELPPDDAAVVVANTDSRYVAPETAADRVADAVDRYPASFVYKKVDSTLRGNLPMETAAAVGATGANLAVVAPAFPATGRITVGGTHLVDGTPVARTDAGQDSEQPVLTSHVPTLFADGTLAVEHVPIEDVAGGGSSLAKRFAAAADPAAPTAVVCDAAREAHLEAIATVAASVDGPVVHVGSGGLARHARLPTATGAGGTQNDPADRSVLGVVGSASPWTFEQLAELDDDDDVVTIDGRSAVSEPDAAVTRAADDVGAILARGDRAVVTAARSPADVEATVAAGADVGLSEAETRERVAGVLAACVRTVRDRHAVGGLFATGGAVATRVLAELDATGVELTGRAVAEGVPIGRAVGGDVDGLPLVTKAGAFGEPEAIVKSLSALARYDD